MLFELGFGTRHMKRILKSNRAYILSYSAVFVLFTAAIVAAYRLSGKSFAWVNDGLEQATMVLAYCGQYLRSYIAGVFSGAGFVPPLWGFSLGLGSDIPQTLSYLHFSTHLIFFRYLFLQKSRASLRFSRLFQTVLCRTGAFGILHEYGLYEAFRVGRYGCLPVLRHGHVFGCQAPVFHQYYDLYAPYAYRY